MYTPSLEQCFARGKVITPLMTHTHGCFEISPSTSRFEYTGKGLAIKSLTFFFGTLMSESTRKRYRRRSSPTLTFSEHGLLAIHIMAALTVSYYSERGRAGRQEQKSDIRVLLFLFCRGFAFSEGNPVFCFLLRSVVVDAIALFVSLRLSFRYSWG